MSAISKRPPGTAHLDTEKKFRTTWDVTPDPYNPGWLICKCDVILNGEIARFDISVSCLNRNVNDVLKSVLDDFQEKVARMAAFQLLDSMADFLRKHYA